MARQKNYKTVAEYKHAWYIENKERILSDLLQKSAEAIEQRKRREKCVICLHYFYTSKENQRYCSSSCSKQADILRSKKFGDSHKIDKKDYDRFYRDAHKEKIKLRGRIRHLKKKYGITANEYDEMFNKQSGRCAICGKQQKDESIALSIDHDHKTGAIRGLLCFGCNSGIGRFNDDISMLKKAIDYLTASLAK
jgi:hypothetical protein